MVTLATSMIRKIYNLDIRLSFYDALKRIPDFWLLHKIWETLAME